MKVDLVDAGLFLLAATVLLGSPGPGIAALVAVGRGRGFVRSLKFYAGLQVGLAVAASICAAGLFSLIRSVPHALGAMSVLAAAYLAVLAWKIATAPVKPANGADAGAFAETAPAGFLLGVTNPKAYVAILSLLASYTLIRSDHGFDTALKLALCVAVIVVVDIVWLGFGAAIGRARPPPRTERVINVAMGATILATAVFEIAR